MIGNKKIINFNNKKDLLNYRENYMRKDYWTSIFSTITIMFVSFISLYSVDFRPTTLQFVFLVLVVCSIFYFTHPAFSRLNKASELVNKLSE